MYTGIRRIFINKINYCRTLKTIAPRVRFAPSPTGYLHLGGLRTALYNYLFAKSRNGTFILRIEDTDQSRKVEGSTEAIIQDLLWAGIECDEGPIKGGNFGPYVQSERLSIYQEHITKLLGNGSAYRCFCTDRRMNILRRNAIKNQQLPKYDNRCRNLTDEDIKVKMEQGIPFCIRFKLSSDCQYYEDLIFGKMQAYDVSQSEGDPIVMKSDGYPTYHFANVVDDHLMNITHVLRGVEWQISTTKHLLIYRAFGWSPPQFGHVPLILNSDGSKLSKRQSDVTVEDYRSKGVLPLALVNYLTLSGGGFEHVPGAGVRFKDMEELTNEFQISRVSSHPSRLNPDLLEECNRLELKRQLRNDKQTQKLVARLKHLIQTAYPDSKLNVSEEYMRTVLNWAVPRISKIEDLVSEDFGFLWVLPDDRIEADKDLLENLVLKLEKFDKFEEDALKEFFKEFSLKKQVKLASLMKTLRSALSGLKEGPRVVEMMYLLGKDQSLKRIKAVIK